MSEATRAPAASIGPAVTAGGACLVLFLGTVAGWASLEHSTMASTNVMLLILTNVLLILGALGVEATRRPYSLHLMHMLSLFLFLGTASLFQYSYGRFAVAGPINAVRNEVAPALIAVTLWLAGYLAAYEGHRMLVKRTQGPVARFLGRPLTPLRTSAILMLAGLSLAYLGAAGLSGAATRGAALESMRSFASQAGAGGYTSVFYLFNQLLLRAFSLVAIMAALLVFLRHPRGRSAVLFLLLLLSGAGVLIFNNPFAAARMWLAITLIAFSAPFFLRRMKTGTTMIAIALGGIALLPALHESRYALSFDEWWNIFQLVSPLEYLQKSSDVDSLGMLALCQRWIDGNGHRFGMQTLGSLLFWVPRTLWSDKPIETGAMVTGDLGFEFTNLASPIMADSLIDFGLIGVPAIAALFGLLLSRLDVMYWQGPDAALSGPRVIDCIYPFWLGLVIFMTRGGSFASFTWTVSFSAWILLFAVAQSSSEQAGRGRQGIASRAIEQGARG